MIPTVDTIRYDFLTSALVKAHQPVLLTGPVGTGKTSVAQKVLENLDSKWSILTINMSAQVRQVSILILLIIRKKIKYSPSAKHCNNMVSYFLGQRPFFEASIVK